MKPWRSLLFALTTFTVGNANAQEYKTLTDFGANPGELSAKYSLGNNSTNALFVLLHGCGQNGVELANNSGLSHLSMTKEFALLAIQQHASNNATTCFNWFSKADQEKGKGETLSIMNMIDKTKQLTQSKRVYIVGLSAGGAMASNLLSQYPESFEAGAVVAGIPYPCANNLIKAISCMKSGSSTKVEMMADELTNNGKKWPRLIVITGDKDAIVSPTNSQQMAHQWRLLTGAENHLSKAKTTMTIDKWQGDRSEVELITLKNVGHGFPINAKQNSAEKPAPYVLDSSFSTANYIVNAWLK